ncbi:hypothetical protein RISK_001816 [Rhodopirellula islandica]|uniref:Uncharacterized protein n=1 Tax=Rhodopirellula islandica TaxID=595434 RepID=A0A0J1BHE9_RHOIS|nr:hypothetical protein RISK_001816 [Rhodopirellula islandica]
MRIRLDPALFSEQRMAEQLTTPRFSAEWKTGDRRRVSKLSAADVSPATGKRIQNGTPKTSKPGQAALSKERCI